MLTITHLVLSPEDKLADESETERHRLGPDSAEHVLSRAEIDPLVHGLVGAVDDELTAGDGQPLVIERIHLDLLQGVVDVLLLEPLVDGGGPALGDTEETDVVDGVSPTEVEHCVIRLADKEWTHRDVARIPQRLAIGSGPVIIDQVVDLN